MPKYVVIGLRGEQITVNAPEGATQAQAQAQYDRYLNNNAYVNREREKLATAVREAHPSRRAAREVWEETPAWKKPLIGMGQSVANTLSGASQLFGSETVPGTGGRTHADIAQLNEDTPWGVSGTLGKIAGEAAQVALPAGALAKTGKVGPLVAETLASAAQGALQPGSAKERAVNAGIGAAAGAVPMAFGGIKPIGEAAEISARARAAGVPMRMSPGQQGGGMWGAMEESFEAAPVLGSAIKGRQRQGLQDWNRLVLNEVSPDGGIETWGQTGLRQVDNQFNRGYAEVIDQAPERLAPKGMDGFTDEVVELAEWLKPEDEAAFLKAAGKLEHDVTKGHIPRDQAKHYKKQFSEQARAAARDGNIPLAKAYTALSERMSSVLKANLPDEAAQRLAHLDDRYRSYLPVVRGHALKGAAKEDLMTPEQLLGGIKGEDASLRDKAFALGTMPMQQETQAAIDSLGRKIPAVGPGTAEKLASLQIQPWLLGTLGTVPYLMSGRNAARPAMEAMARYAPGAMSQSLEGTVDPITQAIMNLEGSR